MFQQIINSMKDPAYYPHDVQSPIQVRETHISWVFLTGTFAYKIKKPVVFGGILDFSTKQTRQYYVLEEIRLNQRLEPDMYLGAVSLSPNGISAPGALNEQYEYAVKMKQYPEDKLMYHVLNKEHTIQKAVLHRIAQRLAVFHANTSSVPEAGEIQVIKRKIEENFETTQSMTSLDTMYVKRVKQFMSKNEALFNRRIADERIRDNHGDVQPRNIFLLPDREVIFDCIEFNPLLRQGDVAEEIAFLAMELDYQGLHELSAYFIHEYMKASKDYELEHIIRFYQSYRALVRAKVAFFRANEQTSKPEQQVKTLQEAKAYLNLAYSYFS